MAAMSVEKSDAGRGSGSPAPSDFERVEEALSRSGARGALEALAEALEREKKYPQLFEALLMQSRAALGLPLIPLGPATDLPEEVLRPHEDSIAAACRKVGGLYLAEGDIVAAWPYFRALGETAPVAAAIRRIEPGSKRKDLEELIDIAFHQGVEPRRGLEMLLANSGICSSITAMERSLPAVRETQQDCVRVLVRALYEELVTSVRADIARRGVPPEAKGGPPGAKGSLGPFPGEARLADLIAGRPWLFADGGYHADPSHLWSIIRLSAALETGPELDLALELADYGSRLAALYHYKSDPPFEEFYRDHTIYLSGRRVRGGPENERAAAHFLDKARAARGRGDDRYPLGAVLEILTRLGRAREAVDLSLEMADSPLETGTPSLGELCQRAGEFNRLAEVSRARGDLLGFAAGIVQSAQTGSGKPRPASF